MTGPTVPPAYQALIDSPRVSTGTRQALQARAVADDPAYRPMAITLAQLNILRAVIQRVIPQPSEVRIDLGARLEAQLAKGEGDGWRFAILPDDIVAYRLGLDDLDAHSCVSNATGFAALDGGLQEEILHRAHAGELHGRLDGAQMRRWFEDLRADAVKLYVAHPATLARMGYSGIAYAGDDGNMSGFGLVGLDEREAWEPLPDPPAASLL